MAGNDAIVKAFQDAKRDLDGAFQMPAYAAVHLLAESIGAVGEDPAKVADYLHKNTFNTGIFKVEYDAKGRSEGF